MSLVVLMLVSLAVALTLTTLVWLISLPLRDASIIDVFWGLGFIAVAWISLWLTETTTAHAWLIVGLVTLWGLRLSGYIAWRNRGKGEDRRYRELREKIGENFPWLSLPVVFWLQGALIAVVSLPVQAGIQSTDTAQVGWQVAGAAVWAAGWMFETVGDWQLARFKADPANAGRVCDRGLWRYTRHPNYFGDFLVWWGMYLLAAAVGAWWTLPGPLVMSVLLLRVSGVTLLERSLQQRKPGYADYVRRTSSFFPWPPRKTPQ